MSKRQIFDYSNISYGNNALNSTLPDAINNIAFGTESLTHNVTGDDNIAMGFASLKDNISGSGNTVIGSYGLQNNISGARNTCIGYNSGNGIINSIGNIFIGYNSGINKNNSLVISNSSTNNLILGDFSSQKIGFCYGNGSITGALSGDISIDGQNNRLLTVERSNNGDGKNLTISAGNANNNGLNNNGGSLLLKSGTSVGTGKSSIICSVSEIGTNSIENIVTDRLIISSPLSLSLSKNSLMANPLFIINIPVGQTSAGSFELGISIRSSTDLQSYQDTYSYSITNKDGTLLSNFTNIGSVVSSTSGTFNIVMNFIKGSNQITVRPNINVGLIAGNNLTGYAYFTIRNNSNSVITLL